MVTILNGILLTKKEGSWTNPENNKTYDYKNIEVGVIDDDKGIIMKISCPNDFILSRIEYHKTYNFKVDIPTQFNERSKVKLIDIMEK